ncbi:MAG: hypothetical protein ACWGN7_06810 [Thermodesulfovibrionales bacterium]
MKRFLMLFLVVILSLSVASFALAGGGTKGTIKSIDAANKTIVFNADGSSDEVTMSVSDTVDLSKVKAGAKAEVFTEEKDGKTMVKGIKPARKVIVGC